MFQHVPTNIANNFQVHVKWRYSQTWAAYWWILLLLERNYLQRACCVSGFQPSAKNVQNLWHYRYQLSSFHSSFWHGWQVNFPMSFLSSKFIFHACCSKKNKIYPKSLQMSLQHTSKAPDFLLPRTMDLQVPSTWPHGSAPWHALVTSPNRNLGDDALVCRSSLKWSSLVNPNMEEYETQWNTCLRWTKPQCHWIPKRNLLFDQQQSIKASSSAPKKRTILTPQASDPNKQCACTYIVSIVSICIQHINIYIYIYLYQIK